jgi:hypothetical protein
VTGKWGGAAHCRGECPETAGESEKAAPWEAADIVRCSDGNNYITIIRPMIPIII